MKRISILIRYALIIVGTVLSMISVFVVNDYTTGEGFSASAKMLIIVDPIVCIIIIVINEILLLTQKLKKHYLSYAPIIFLALVIGANSIANFINSLSIVDPCAAIALLLWIVLFVIDIICDKKTSQS